jgi:hypothetical protein
VNVSTILWRRLDTEGHDACRLVQQGNGWRLEGTAVFRQESELASLTYTLDCDHAWRTRDGLVQGWIGPHSLDFRFARLPDDLWTLNGQIVSHLKGCVDLDLGFTPATNLSQIRRIALRVGDAADVPAAWFDVPAGTLEKLHQRYERRTEDTYWYESPRFGYSALLYVNAVGFVERYPDLWEAVP